MKRAILIAMTAIAIASFAELKTRAADPSTESLKAIEAMPSAEPQTACPTILSGPVVTVAPNQPEVEPHSTVGIINALCDVTLNFAGCGFTPATINITCDTNGDGVPELSIPLKNITILNRLLLQARIPALSPQLPGSAFPLACCGGIANIILSRTITGGDDNAFGTITQTQTCQIDLGIRAPVVISASPAEGDCSTPQNLVIPGSCFLLADGKPNVTSVFAVERGNPNNVIQSKHFVILNTNLIDALFDFGASSEGRSFLIFASGPNGTSRNLTSLPQGAQPDCPLGNEQGVMITFTCKTRVTEGPAPHDEPPPSALVFGCSLERDSSGVFSLNIVGRLFLDGARVTIAGAAPKKLKFKDFDSSSNTFSRIKAKGKVCGKLPGIIVVANPLQSPSQPFFCGRSCAN